MTAVAPRPGRLVAALAAASLLAPLAFPGSGIAATIRAKSFNTATGIVCKGSTGSVVCRNRKGISGRVGRNGKARIGRSGALPRGVRLKGRTMWTNGTVTCGIPDRVGISCYAGNGHGFYLSAAGATRF